MRKFTFWSKISKKLKMPMLKLNKIYRELKTKKKN